MNIKNHRSLRTLVYGMFFIGTVFAGKDPFVDERYIGERSIYHRLVSEPHSVGIASPGRSGSTLLTDVLETYAVGKEVYKVHMLPPEVPMKGKIVFIFGSPDQAAESALSLMLLGTGKWATVHFKNIETADNGWLADLGNIPLQTVTHNLLLYDALGTTQQLNEWLLKTRLCTVEDASILAIKYECLWEEATVKALKDFLGIAELVLPPYKSRGSRVKHDANLAYFRSLYNKGSEDDPRYETYKEARAVWEAAPAVQFLKQSVLPLHQGA